MQRRAVGPIAAIAVAVVGLWSALAPVPRAAPSAPVLPGESPSTVAAEVATSSTTTTLSTTTTTAASTTTLPASTAAPALPVPERVPADPRADVAVVPIGWIEIPEIGLDHPIFEGVWLTVIDVGPGHWPGTPWPGGYGNAVFGGHRVTHTHPFLDLDQLDAGDEIRFVLVDGSRHTYRVTEQFVVEPTAMWIVDQAPGRTLTLFTCHPKGSARQRLVVRAELVETFVGQGVSRPSVDVA